MAVFEKDILIKHKDEEGNVDIIYPVTKIANVVDDDGSTLEERIGDFASRTLTLAEYNALVESGNIDEKMTYNIIDDVNASNDGSGVGHVDEMTGATNEADGVSGLVPKPLIKDKNSFLRGDGTWRDVNLSSKGDKLYYDKDSSELYLKSGDEVLSHVNIKGDGTIVVGTLNITVDDDLLYGATVNVVNVSDGVTVYNAVIDLAGKAVIKVIATGDYMISFPAYQKYTGSVIVDGIGKVYNIPIHVPHSNITVLTESESLFGKSVAFTFASALMSTKVFDENNRAVFKAYEVGVYKATCEVYYEENVDVAELETNYEIHLNTIPDGATIEPINDVYIWLKCANLYNTGYTTLEQVLADTTTIGSLTMDENAMTYLARSEGFADTLVNNETFMTYLGQSAYVDTTVLNSSSWLDKICNSDYFESVLNVKVPTMTSNTTPSGEAKAINELTNSEGTYYVANIFGASIGTGLYSGVAINPPSGQWVQYKFENPVIVKKVYVKGYNNSANHRYDCCGLSKDIVIEGSNDGVAFDVLHTFIDAFTESSPVDSGGFLYFTSSFNNNTPYKYYRLKTDGNIIGGYFFCMKRLQFYGRSV